MADLYTLVNSMRTDGTFQAVALNPAAQFGRTPRNYVGASVLPERLVKENAFREEAIRFRTIVANDGTRYSPVQLKKGELTSSMLVELAESDIGREFTSKDYDTLISLLAVNQSMEAVAALTNWLDTSINLALIEQNEKQRWQAIVDSLVERRGDNDYTEDVELSDPTGHRVAQSNPWSTDSTDIFEEIYVMADLLKSKGFTVGRMITSSAVLAKMLGNDEVKKRTGRLVVSSTGQIGGVTGRAAKADLDNTLQSDGLPAIETYDLKYNTQTGTEYFLKRDVFVMLATTGRSELIDFGTEVKLFDDTLGYMAIGRPAGQSDPGRVIRAEPFANKPPRIEAEGWQTSFPIIQEPEAIAVIHTIT